MRSRKQDFAFRANFHWDQVFLYGFVIKHDTEAGLVWHGNISVPLSIQMIASDLPGERFGSEGIFADLMGL
jgi:hypothetical protein